MQTVKVLAGKHGDFDADKSLIRIRESTPEIMQQTFLHELAHCIYYCYGHPEEFENEGIVEAMAQGLYQWFKTAV